MIRLLNIEDIRELEALLLDSYGCVVPVPAKELSRFSPNQISLFCHKHAVYQVPTIELIDFLRSEIAGRPAIEIGAGNGCIGTALGIPITDTKAQDSPEMKHYYSVIGQPRIKYHPKIIKISGNDAVISLKPKVVVACWVTQLFKPGLRSGFYDGVDEIKLCSAVDSYILVGNDNVHGDKEVLNHYQFERYKFDWLYSRSIKKDNTIYIYRKLP